MDDRDAVRDIDENDEEDGEGEDLFADNIEEYVLTLVNLTSFIKLTTVIMRQMSYWIATPTGISMMK